MKGKVPPPWLRRTAEFFSAPGVFTCEGAGGVKGAAEIPVFNEIDPPESPSLVGRVEKKLGKRFTPALREWFRVAGAGILFGQSTGPDQATGFFLYPPSYLVEAQRNLLRQLRDSYRSALELAEGAEADELKRELKERVPEFLVLGSAAYSGNYLVLDFGARAEEKPILYLDHEMGYRDCGAESRAFRHLPDLLAFAMKDPVGFLNEKLGCFTRYSDGKTETQWIPKSYRRTPGAEVPINTST